MPSLLERAAGILKKKETEAKAKQQTEQQRDFSKLASILAKGDAATDSDVADLTNIAQRRRLDETKLQEFTEAIAEAGRLTELHGQLDAAREQSRAAQKAKEKASNALIDAKQKARDAAQEAERAVRFVSRCGQAANGLKNLARQHPELFDVTGDVPRLLN